MARQYKYLQVGYVPGCTKIPIDDHTTAKQQTFSFRHADKLSSGRPPIPLCGRAILCGISFHQSSIILTSKCTDVIYFEDCTIFNGCAGKSMFEMIGQTW